MTAHLQPTNREAASLVSCARQPMKRSVWVETLMINLPPKPNDSKIEVQRDFSQTILSWRNPSGGMRRFGVLIFLIAWMGAWVMGEVSVLKQVVKGDGGVFLLFWLAAWTVGGFFCVTAIFELARPSRPEKLTLSTLNLFHEPGTDKVDYLWKQAKSRSPLELFRPRKSRRVARRDISDIRIDRVGERQRLTFDYGAERVEIGQYLEEPEREWLLAVLESWKSA